MTLNYPTGPKFIAAVLLLSAGALFAASGSPAEQNLLKNPGFEETAQSPDNPPNWITTSDSMGKAVFTDREAHGGRHAIAIPAQTAVEQSIGPVLPGAYLARCWVKSESEQPVTSLLRNPGRAGES